MRSTRLPRPLSLTIRCAVAGTWLTAMLYGQSLTISPSTLPSASVGVPYTASLSVSGGVAPYLWFVTGGSLPPGFQVSSSTTGGTISGTSPSTGTYSFTLTVVDSRNNTGVITLSIAVPGGGLVITTASSLPNAAVGQSY